MQGGSAKYNSVEQASVLAPLFWHLCFGGPLQCAAHRRAPCVCRIVCSHAQERASTPAAQTAMPCNTFLRVLRCLRHFVFVLLQEACSSQAKTFMDCMDANNGAACISCSNSPHGGVLVGVYTGCGC